jgi:histidine triad (HIT) family protein
MTECKFCRIVSGDLPASIVLDDRFCVAFLDSRPLFHGHSLLVPRAHYETLMDLPDTLIGPLFSDAKLLCSAIEESMGADGTFVAINNRVSQSVPHIHVHIVPRRRKDGMKGFFWPRHPYSDDEQMRGVADRIRAAVEKLKIGRDQELGRRNYELKTPGPGDLIHS